MIGLIEAGEAGGILSDVLDRLASLLEASKIKGQITGALIYPILILVLAVSVSLGLLIFIVPKFETMFAEWEQSSCNNSFHVVFIKNSSNVDFFDSCSNIIIHCFYLFKISYATPAGRIFRWSCFKIPF